MDSMEESLGCILEILAAPGLKALFYSFLFFCHELRCSRTVMRRKNDCGA